MAVVSGVESGDRYERLAALAVDDPRERTALAVLAAHGHWLAHDEFVRACVQGAHGELWVVWKTAGRFVDRTECTALEREVLRLAVELAESGTVKRFAESVVFDELDDEVRKRMAAAIDEDGPRLDRWGGGSRSGSREGHPR